MLSCVITIWWVQVCYFSISFFLGVLSGTPPAARHQASGRPQCNPLRSRCLRSPWPCPWTPGAGWMVFIRKKEEENIQNWGFMEISLGFMRSLCGLMGFNCQYGILWDYYKPSINGVLWDFTIQYVECMGIEPLINWGHDWARPKIICPRVEYGSKTIQHKTFHYHKIRI